MNSAMNESLVEKQIKPSKSTKLQETRQLPDSQDYVKVSPETESKYISKVFYWLKKVFVLNLKTISFFLTKKKCYWLSCLLFELIQKHSINLG